ncbi:MAG: peptidylprolyl isomerase, partial [Anaerolineales bacterium]|nr:peptidylprolyl isomerase [Anaerolineales bacterium]
TLTDDAGTVIDSSNGQAPLAYLHGVGNLIPGLENALEGQAAGAALQVRVEPEHGYGVRDERLVQAVPREAFEGGEIEVGMRFRARTDDGEMVFTVVEVGRDKVTVDGNHPLAGVPLNFAVTVVGVRDATAEELSHGHVHDGHTH